MTGPSSRAVRVMRCTPEDVFAVLSDGWLYPAVVAGASRMREVDESWPSPGASLHHSFGVWPLLVNDRTDVLEAEPPRRLVLRPRGWPIGEAKVTITIDDAPRGVRVTLHEEATRGPGRFIPRPIIEPAIWLRCRETLHRLSYLAQARARAGSASPG